MEVQESLNPNAPQRIVYDAYADRLCNIHVVVGSTDLTI